MKILVDENMPYAYKLFSRFGEVTSISGRSIPESELNGANVLIVRSVTQVNKSLLEGKAICFVGTATAGTDHIDEVWLKKEGIGFSFAPGCNSISVVEYVFSALLALAERDNFLLEDRTIGIIGVGNIGRHLQKCLEVLGICTLLCDPPRANNLNEDTFLSLDELIERADVLTFHTPLYNDGPYKTLHLLNEELIRKLKPNTILINACRGPVIDNTALLNCLRDGQKLSVVLDVWESEPNLNIALLERIDIATAHIAGHSLEGKIRGTIQIFEKYSNFIGKPQKISLNTLLPIPKFGCITLHGPLDQTILKRLVHLVYDVRRDDAFLRKVAAVPGAFDELRKKYFERREWSSLNVICDQIEAMKVLQKLGFNAAYTKCINV